LGRRKLGFERIASTAAVRTRGNFGIIPSPYDADFERKIRSKSADKIYEQSMCESLARKLFLKLESFATRCEALLPCDRERCIIKAIFVAGGRTGMAISYNKLWKLLVDKKMSKADLRKAAGIAPNTMTRLRRDEEVTLSVLSKICSTLNVDIGDIMEFMPEANLQD
jgi:putative transcriptional regulator